jgi:RNA polymerase sigma factor (sigma-70 family)
MKPFCHQMGLMHRTFDTKLSETPVNDIADLIAQVKTGDLDAYEPIVRRFQDMAVGYAYAMLGDLQLAEDAAQESFIAAYLALPSLQEPQAFPGWFRRIVIKQIDRIRRRRKPTIALDAIAEIESTQLSLFEAVDQKEVNELLVSAIQSLSTFQREVVALYYIGEYSQQEISAFLDIPVSTVKMRLYHARKLLKQQLLCLIEDALPNQRPSKDNRFVEKLMNFQVQTKQLPTQKVISRTRHVFINELQFHLDSSVNALAVYAEAHGARIAGPPLAIYHGAVREDKNGLVEACVPITANIQPGNDMAIRELPAVQVAYTVTTLRQSLFPGVLKAYEEIEMWIKDNGYQTTAPPREIYLNFNRSIFSPLAGWDDPCLEIAWPYT